MRPRTNQTPSYKNSVAQSFEPQPLTFEDLTPTEQAAASLGVQPDALKPIGWLNDAHHEQLKKGNVLDNTLARRIEAFKEVSNECESAA